MDACCQGVTSQGAQSALLEAVARGLEWDSGVASNGAEGDSEPVLGETARE